jgi:hypothetical protein
MTEFFIALARNDLGVFAVLIFDAPSNHFFLLTRPICDEQLHAGYRAKKDRVNANTATGWLKSV